MPNFSKRELKALWSITPNQGSIKSGGKLDRYFPAVFRRRNSSLKWGDGDGPPLAQPAGPLFPLTLRKGNVQAGDRRTTVECEMQGFSGDMSLSTGLERMGENPPEIFLRCSLWMFFNVGLVPQVPALVGTFHGIQRNQQVRSGAHWRSCPEPLLLDDGLISSRRFCPQQRDNIAEKISSGVRILISARQPRKLTGLGWLATWCTRSEAQRPQVRQIIIFLQFAQSPSGY